MRPLLLLTLLLSTPLLAQPLNGGFETTTDTPEGPMPEHWSVTSSFGAGLVQEAHTGTYALGVWNWYWYAPGLANNGSAAWPGADGMPVSGHPTQLSGWYRRDPGLMMEGEWNQAVVTVLLTHWNTASAQRDTVAMGTRLFDEQLEWAPFAVDIDYSSAATPDTVVIQLASCGNCMCSNESTGNCAYFTVDDLALSFAQGITEELMNEQAVRLIDRNDGTLRVHVKAGTPLPLRLQLWDASGRAAADVLVRGDGQSVAVPPTTGLMAYRASAEGQPICAGRVVVR